MSLLRHKPTPPLERSTAQKRIQELEQEVRTLRPSSSPLAPITKASVIPAERTHRALLLLADLARQQIIVGLLDDARRSLGEAVILLDEVTDEATIAQASVMVGEVMLGLDAPQHAKPRFTRAVELLDQPKRESTETDARWRVRARLGLGRTLVALDDITGLTVLEECHQVCKMLGEKMAILQIEEELREAEKVFDTPRHIHTGYGRPVSVAPSALK